jgi:hypothetical protein
MIATPSYKPDSATTICFLPTAQHHRTTLLIVFYVSARRRTDALQCTAWLGLAVLVSLRLMQKKILCLGFRV